MKIFIASDHAAVDEKKALAQFVEAEGHEVIDLGPFDSESVHYPDYARKLCKEVLKEEALGILLCGSGIGMSIMANKFKGIRAALCRDSLDARLAREHNGANVLCLGARVSGNLLLQEITRAWLRAEPEEGRHAQRRSMLDSVGEEL